MSFAKCLCLNFKADLADSLYPSHKLGWGGAASRVINQLLNEVKRYHF